MKKCEFCELLSEKENSLKISEISSSVAVLNRDQLFLGRVLVIHKSHVEDLSELTEKERALSIEDLTKIASAVKKAFNPDTLNYAILGTVVSHLHWHVIPRYKNDPNWGGPPWPHGRKYLDQEQYEKLKKRIREFLS